MTVLVERAPAKVNLSLHIVRRREDGWHELDSLTAFSTSGDILSLRPGEDLSLAVTGPYAEAAGSVDDNLVLNAARQLSALVPSLKLGAFRLHKTLPAAAGIGGGSSDAAATLRLLARLNGIGDDDPRLQEAARKTGSDVPVCLQARARMFSGLGDVLGPLLKLPPLYAVLINPGVPVVTRDVFKRLGLANGEDNGMSKHPAFTTEMAATDLFSVLHKTRNDLEDAASVIAPVITDVLAVIGAARGCQLARMSGSGATCFGLFEKRLGASRAAHSIRKSRPQWWIKACVLR